MSEVENTPAITVGSDKEEIEAFLDALQQSNFNKAEKHFTDILGNRVSDALDQAKIKVASDIYNGNSEEEEEISDEESDDDLITSNEDEEENELETEN